MREFTIRLSHRIRDMIRVDAGARMPDAAGNLGQAELSARQEAERQRQLREEQQAVQRVLAGMKRAVDDLRATQQLLIGDMQKATVDLALTIAGWLVCDRVNKDQYPIERLVREAVERLGPQRPVTVAIHPDDLKLLQKRVPAPLFPEGDAISLIADSSLARGDCLARAGEIEVMSQIDEHLEEIRRSLLRELEHAELAA